MHQVYDAGFDKIIVLGNDCPGLSLQKIKQTVFLLTKNQVVLGPDNRGGCYLMGFDKKSFDSAMLAQLPWQKKSLLHVLIQSLAPSIAFLESLFDVNSSEDIQAIISANQFKKWFYQLLKHSNSQILFYYHAIFKNKFSFFYSFNKGSPFDYQILI
jgi:hypothetical protein